MYQTKIIRSNLYGEYVVKNKEKYDGIVYKKKVKDGVEEVSHVELTKKKKKKKEKIPQILENVPEEFRSGDKKILLEG